MTPNAIAIDQCAHCGANIYSGKLFCGGCGKPTRNKGVDSDPHRLTPQTTVKSPPIRSTVSAAAAAPARAHVPPSKVGPRSCATPLPAQSLTTASPEPMCWETLLLWSTLSFGVVAIVFGFRQSAWAKRMDARSTATVRLMGAYLLSMMSIVILFAGLAVPELRPFVFSAFFMALAAPVLVVLYILSMLDTLTAVASYNGVPVQVSQVKGFFFNVYYFQHVIRTIELHCTAIQNP